MNKIISQYIDNRLGTTADRFMNYWLLPIPASDQPRNKAAEHNHTFFKQTVKKGQRYNVYLMSLDDMITYRYNLRVESARVSLHASVERESILAKMRDYRAPVRVRYYLARNAVLGRRDRRPAKVELCEICGSPVTECGGAYRVAVDDYTCRNEQKARTRLWQ